jgi:hypothetical protein
MYKHKYMYGISYIFFMNTIFPLIIIIIIIIYNAFISFSFLILFLNEKPKKKKLYILQFMPIVIFKINNLINPHSVL